MKNGKQKVHVYYVSTVDRDNNKEASCSTYPKKKEKWFVNSEQKIQSLEAQIQKLTTKQTHI